MELIKVNKDLEELKTRLKEIKDLNSTAAVLYWDQAAYMPPGGAEARGRQIAAISRLAHEKSITPSLRKLLDKLESDEKSLPYDSFDASVIRIARYDYEKAAKIPSSFVQEFTNHQTQCYQIKNKGCIGLLMKDMKVFELAKNNLQQNNICPVTITGCMTYSIYCYVKYK